MHNVMRAFFGLSGTENAGCITTGITTVEGAFYDRGSTFPLKCFLSDGGSLTQIRRGLSILFLTMTLSYA